MSCIENPFFLLYIEELYINLVATKFRLEIYDGQNS